METTNSYVANHAVSIDPLIALISQVRGKYCLTIVFSLNNRAVERLSLCPLE